MSEPLLSAADVRERLDEVFGGAARHRSHLVAFYGKGDEARVATRSAGEFEIVSVASELELRRRIPDFEGDPHMAFLVPWTGSLPLDIGCRFVQNGHILSLGRALRLRRLFNATEVEGAAIESELAKFLFDHAPRASSQTFPFGGGRLTVDAMWSVWLAGELGLGESSAPPALEELLAWATLNEGGAKFAEATATAQPFRAELFAWLERRVGAGATQSWLAWEKAQGRRLFELTLVIDALQASPQASSGEARMWTALKLRELGPLSDADVDAAARGLAAASASTFRRLEGIDAARAHAMLKSAENCADAGPIRAALVWSRLLPSAWTARLDQLGEELAAGAKNPTAAALDTAIGTQRDLERHQAYERKEHEAELERATMAVRLLAWLVERTDKRVPAVGSSVYAEVERAARWYASEGGFVDWARRSARGAEHRAFGRGVNAVVEAVDEVRTELDRAFARALPAWLAANRPSTQVVPIESALEQFGVDFVNERPDRKLLVVLMDGMAWAQAAELLLSLAPWAPIGWHPKQGKASAGPGVVPVIAHLPTVTEVSRAAFFSSKRIPAGKIDATDKDVDRFAKNAAVRKLVADGDTPRLLLRAEGHTLSGAASNEALNLVRDDRQRVAAVVVNAIDASLKSDPQMRPKWRIDMIQPLRDLLEAAMESGRTVLLASDHGHVPADRLNAVPRPAEATSRYRPWKDTSEPLAEYEVAIPKEHAWAPTGAAGIVVLADDAHRYGGSAHAGEHGGATLAEVVAPYVLIGPEHRMNEAAAEPDAALQVDTFRAPSWWFPDMRKPVASQRPPRKNTPPPAKRDSNRPKAVAAAPVEAPAHPLRKALEGSDVFMARAMDPNRRAQLLKAVGFLASRSASQAPLVVFAQFMGTSSARAPGLVSMLSPLLNLDGFDLLRFDPVASLVSLDVEKLSQLYELDV